MFGLTDRRPMIERLALFGATGDLAGRYLLPALAALEAEGALPDGFRVVAAARQEMDDDAFRRLVAERLDAHAPKIVPGIRDRLVRRTTYADVDLADATSVAAMIDGGTGDRVAAYLALPPSLFPVAVTTLGSVGLPRGSRIALEKPFGQDYESAVALNRLLADAIDAADERSAFRVDHALGLSTVQNLLGLRTANEFLRPAWTSAHVERIDVFWEETLALEGRADYYDQTGVLRDVMQNHMLQILCLLAMDPPEDSDEAQLHDRKVAVLRALRPPGADQMRTRTSRARYTAGRVGGRRIPSYADEEGVEPDRRTETFAEVELELETERWAGTRFGLRAGKALGRRRKEAVIRFRPSARVPAGHASRDIPWNELRIGIDGPHDLVMSLTGRAAGSPGELVPLTLAGPPPRSAIPAYGRVLLDILEGGTSLSVRGDEAEHAWRVLTPVIQAFAADEVPLREYPAGSDGPAQLGFTHPIART
jgi:glucose-6-phosphate 1-dehydrogenase